MRPSLIGVPGWILCLALLFLIILVNWAGFEYRKYLAAKKPQDMPESVGTLEGSLLGLMALLLAFSFNMAATKYESRRATVIDEANVIEVVALRIKLYPDSLQAPFYPELISYIDARHQYYQSGHDHKKIKESLELSHNLAGKIWKRTMDYSRIVENKLITQAMIAPLNEMIDMITKREGLREAKVPPLIMLMLICLTLVAAFISGYSHKARKRNRVLTLAFALMTSFTVYLIIELDRPQRGLITIGAAEQKILEVKDKIQNHLMHE